MLATQQIFFIAALLCSLTFLALGSVASEGVPGTRPLLASSLLGVAGNILYAFGRELPPLLAYEAANVVYAASGAALLAGYRILWGNPPRLSQLCWMVVVLGLLIGFFHYLVDSFVGRSAVVSTLQIVICGEIARTSWTSRHKWQPPFYIYIFVLAMCALVALGHAGRMAWLLLASTPPGSLLQPSVWSVSFLTAVSVALPALAIGGLLITHRQIVVRAEHAANHDHLTGAASRRAFFEIAAREIARAERNGRPLALLLVDLDNFKTINDSWGHEAGDTALLRVAHAARNMLRVVDCVARLGGDEFVLLLPDTGLHGAAAVGAKLQHAVRHADQARASSPVLTLSIGVTLFSPGEDIKCAMARADEALYAAKAAGRDRVEVKCHEPPLSLVPRRA